MTSPTPLQTRLSYAKGTPAPRRTPIVGDLGSFDDPAPVGITEGILAPASGDWVIVFNDEGQGVAAARHRETMTAFERFWSPLDEARWFLEPWESLSEEAKSEWVSAWLLSLLRHVLPEDDVQLLLAHEASWLVRQ